MLTLTTATQFTRRAIVFLLFTVVLGIFLLIIFSTIKNTLERFKPPPRPILVTTFGKIPQAKFPQQVFPTDVKFSIETLSGTIPSASPTAKVYFLPKKQLGLLTNIRAIQDARKISFVDDPQTYEKKFLFKNTDSELIFDPISRNFTYTFNYVNNGLVFEGENTLNSSTVLSIAQNFFSNLSAIPQDYDSQNPKITFLTFNGAQFVPTAGGSDNVNATAVQVDFFRKNIDSMPVVTPKNNEGNIYAIVSKSQEPKKQVIKAQRAYQEISQEQVGVYPLRSGQSAWEDFLNGNGYIANPGDSTFSKKVVIRDAYLAYYDNPEYQSYLTPIYVFVGDGGFIAYANAVNNEWLTND